MENLTIRSLFEDSRGRIWIGTIDKGVYLWTDDNKPLIHLGTEQGLPSIVVTAIQEDSSGEIWLATMKGMVHVDPVKLSLKTINSTHGLLAMTVNRGAFITSRSGTLYIGGIEGMSRFNPKELKPEKGNFPVKLTRLKIFNKEIFPGDISGKISDGLNQLKQLNLTYEDNMFAFDFAALNYHLSLQNQFAYMLEGFDKDWIYTGQKNNATYTNIPAGSYTFKVKAANSDNVWSDNQINLPIYITPSPWKTIPAYIAYGLIFIAVIFVLYRQQQARIHLKHERKINQALTRINEIKDAFLANTAHELRTPVGGMVGLATQLVEELDLPHEANYKLELIISSGRRLSSLINDILDYSKMSEAKIELFKSWVDLHLLVEKIFSIVEPMAQNKKISLHNNTSCDVRAWADAARLEQMLLNLVSNAIKYSDSGSVSVDASALNGFLNIAVNDSGIGISPDDIEKLFIPFQQLKASAGRRIGGTGLGLAVTRFLVEQHDGEIKVESELGKGSTFILKIPLPKENSADVMVKNTVAQQSTLHAPNLAGEDVVYADDDVINCMLLKKQLMDTSANLHEANNGLAAWGLIQQYPALKFLFLDLQMSQLDGFEVAERQRTSGFNDRLPIIFLTANITQTDIEKAKKLGITRILLKPITKQSLWQHMTELLEESAAKES